MEINGQQAKLTLPCSSSKSTQPGDRPEPLQASWISALFAKLQVRYGHRWVSAYPAGKVQEVALAEWSEGLAGFTGNEIKRGLDTWNNDWPPTLPEFKAACRPGRLAAAHAPFPKLPAPVKKLSHSLGKFLRKHRAGREA